MKKATSLLFHLIKWTLLSIPIAMLAGSLVALFLWLLDEATTLRLQQPWLLYLLPLAGIGIHFLYKKSGKNAEAGNNLVLEEIHQPGAGVPARMAPLVLATTVITHLFGGSAGREGTAVQIGGSMADWLSRLIKLTAEDRRILLMCGIAAGFGAVFGTPLTGAVFAMEVLAIGAMRYDALVPCLAASVFADLVCSEWGIHHTQYQIATPFIKDLSLAGFLLLGKVIIAGVSSGLAARLFSISMHTVKKLAVQYIRPAWLAPGVGGVIVIALCWVLGTRDYIGLGVTGNISITAAFHEGGAETFSWLWKLIFTVITLAMGFKGGEVTPLFFIGATLGNTIALLMGAPVDLFAGLCFIAVFAGATNTPIACTLMGAELFGTQHILFFAVACFTAYYFSGQSGIYTAQRTALPKL
ncbi:voltage-gated chloride channel family protein [Chitinophaga sedimenti]|uniref:voltage-gated chloride channel family protein n=1 Tax=Chitinophaga sedimenti TaxID=2033606 RepID=UPI0020047068|nr:voltage-gated chloride channel family protein [Chitinophaga sedimenti]MCK7555352.1 voltage-gated chloride channel family protein [Chitinophaga sedimenti]